MSFSQQFTFLHRMEVLNDPQSNENTIINIMNELKNDICNEINTVIMSENIKMMHLQCVSTIDYWKNCYNDIKKCEDMLGTKYIIKKYFATTNIYNYSKLNVGQGCMRAITHILWKKLATLCTNSYCECKTLENAGIYHYRLLVTDIAHESGFTNTDDFMDYLEKL